MSVKSQKQDHCLYSFEKDYRISYVSFSRMTELTDAQLLITLEKDYIRRTFAFSQPHFNDVDKNLVSSQGIYITTVRDSPLSPNRIEVGDLETACAYFSAKNVREITPSV